MKTTVDSEKVLKAAVNQKTLVGTLRRVNKIKLKNGLTPISDLKVPSYVKLDQNGVPTNTKSGDGKAAAYSGGWALLRAQSYARAYRGRPQAIPVRDGNVDRFNRW